MGLLNKIRQSLRWVGAHELGAILSIVGLAAGSWVFIQVADEVAEGDLKNIDERLLLALRDGQNPQVPAGPQWLQQVAQDVTALGSLTVMGLLGVAVCGYLIILRKPRNAMLVGAAAFGGYGVSFGLKQVFERARPALVPHLSQVSTASFPSSHSMVSAAVYLTLGALLARTQRGLVFRAYVLLWGLFLALLVGMSRVYLGVHWPSDVLAGWAGGAAWAGLCWLMAEFLQRRGGLDAPRSGPAEAEEAELHGAAEGGSRAL